MSPRPKQVVRLWSVAPIPWHPYRAAPIPCGILPC